MLLWVKDRVIYLFFFISPIFHHILHIIKFYNVVMKGRKNMKRKTKNIITIMLISVLLVCMYFTVINNVSNNQSSVQNNQMGGMII